VLTDKQIQIRESFAAAALYAEGALSDPELKKAYEKKATPGKPARIVAAKDYLKAPVVRRIDAEKYTGVAGSVITVSALDDFRVAEVTVSIHTVAGVLVEEGNAILNPLDRSKWIYTALQANAARAGSKISATAFDLPRNKGTLEITL
jgi:BioD-like phosphotransacetylase family protein